MSTSDIEWTDYTWNPMRGCTRISPGCENCYAESIAVRFSGPGLQFEGYAKSGKNAGWTGKVGLIEDKLFEPLHLKKPQRIFVNSMSDLFHEKFTDDDIDHVFAVMMRSAFLSRGGRPLARHTFQVLTKREDRMFEYMIAHDRAKRIAQLVARCEPEEFDVRVAGLPWPFQWPLPNLHLGVSVENQKYADRRITRLLHTPAVRRVISYEPALGPVTLESTNGPDGLLRRYLHPNGGLDQVIVGGESGTGARRCEIDWIESIVRECDAANEHRKDNPVRVFVKQLGDRPVRSYDGNRSTADAVPLYDIRSPKGGDMDEWPDHLRRREMLPSYAEVLAALDRNAAAPLTSGAE